MQRILIVCFLAMGMASNAQYTPEESTTAPHLLKASLLSPGVEYEFGFGRYNSFNLFAGVTPAVGYASDDVLYFINPGLKLQYRYYYNLRRRSLKNKPIDYNSANFLALQVSAVGNTLLSNADRSRLGHYGAGLAWGLQRTFKSGIYISAYAGPGVGITSNATFNPQLHAGLRIGYVFRKDPSPGAKIRRMEREQP